MTINNDVSPDKFNNPALTNALDFAADLINNQKVSGSGAHATILEGSEYQPSEPKPSFAPAQEPESSNIIGGLILDADRFFDNSTINEFRVCPRRYYFRHVRQFSPRGLKAALVFGTSWHAAMDFIWINCKRLKDPELLENAYNVFLVTWRSAGITEEMDLELYPRSPGRAREMLIQYIARVVPFIRDVELIAVELPFIVPLSLEHANLFYIGRWDKVYKELQIVIADHKTASSFSSTWMDSFSPNGQVDGYHHGGLMTYGEDFWGVKIDGALVQKTQIDFRTVPIQRQDTMLDAWAYETEQYIEMIQYNEDMLREIRLEYKNPNKPSRGYLPVFPKNTTMCTSYYGACPYLDQCRYVGNPEYMACPVEFEEKKWEPFKVERAQDGSFKATILEGD